jgi:Domain of unknown function (DUF4837)
MFRLALILLLFATGLLSSCEEYENKPVTNTAGKLDELMFIVNDKYIEQALSDSLIFHFGRPYPGLPQLHEPLFPMKIRSFKRYLRNRDVFNQYRNLIFVSPFDDDTKINRFIKKEIGKQNITKVNSNSDLFYFIKKNQYASPQLVIYLFAPDIKSLTSRLRKHKEELFEIIKQSENEKFEKVVFAKGENIKASQSITRLFNFSLKIPSDFHIAEQNNNFLRLARVTKFFDKKENLQKKILVSIMIEKFSLDSIDYVQNVHDDKIEASGMIAYPFSLTDSLFKYHVIGMDSTYHPYVDKDQLLFQKVIHRKDITILENRGLWRLDKPFMGGPVYNYTFIDKERKNLIVMSSYVFAAGADKRKIIRKIELIFSTLSFP